MQVNMSFALLLALPPLAALLGVVVHLFLSALAEGIRDAVRG